MRPTSILALALLALLLASSAFGAPADDLQPIVQGSEILAKIERGEPVEYDDVFVVGDLDLSGVDLPTKHIERTRSEIKDGLTEEVKVVESSIWIENSEIRGGVTLGNAIFQESVNFEGFNFTEDAWFLGANFSSGRRADFEGTNFSGYANFRETVFSDDDDFITSGGPRVTNTPTFRAGWPHAI